MTQNSRYLLVTPCRDEAAFARRTLESVVNQTVRPTQWILVDDGSTDETPEILEEYAERFPWIRVIRREDRGERKVGPGVIEAFYFGWEKACADEFDFVCKFDLDLDLPSRYFEILIERMQANPRIGTCSGKPYFENAEGQLVSEACGNEMSVGMTKFYRTECFLEIGGFVKEVMWDGIDCHTCRLLGWLACSWDDAELRFVHLRPMGSSQQSLWGRAKTPRVRTMVHGNRIPVHAREFPVPHDTAAAGSWRVRHAMGLPSKRSSGGAPLRQPRVPQVPETLSTRLPHPRKGESDCEV